MSTTTENPKKNLDLAGARYLVGRVKSLVKGASETAEKASKNTINVNTVKNATLAQGKAPVKAGEGGSYLYLDEGRDSLLLKHQGNYYVNWEDAEDYGTVVFGRGVTPPVDSPDIPERLYLAREDDGRLFYWNDGFSEIANNKIVGLVAAIIKADVLVEYGSDGLTIGEQVSQDMARIKNILDAGVLNEYGDSGETIGSQVQENLEAIEGLKDTLDRILDSNGVQHVIDTFKDMEDFLQGITDTTTLTALLQEQSRLIGGRRVIFIHERVQSVPAVTQGGPKLDTGGSVLVYNEATDRILLKTGSTFYTAFPGADVLGSYDANGVIPQSNRLYIAPVPNEEFDLGYNVFLWNGTFLESIHANEIDNLTQRVQDLEDAEPEAITIEEIDAMFDGYSMSGPEPAAPTN